VGDEAHEVASRFMDRTGEIAGHFKGIVSPKTPRVGQKVVQPQRAAVIQKEIMVDHGEAACKINMSKKIDKFRYLKFCASVLATTNIPSPLETAKELIN
jgi:hypothetical protein